MMGSVFASVDHDKFKALRITHLAARFEELGSDQYWNSGWRYELRWR